MGMRFWEAALRQSEGESGGAPLEAPVPTEAPAPLADTNTEAVETPPVDEAPASKPPQGLLDRIGQLTRQKRELEERLVQYEQTYQPSPQQVAPQGQGYDPQEINLEIHRRAQELARQQQWKDTTDKVWNEGLSKYADWGPQLNNMAMILGGIPQSLTEAAIESGAPHEVLYHLARNPDEAARVALLPVAKQAVAVATLAQGLKKKVSSAPPPITPKVNGQGAVQASLDDTSMTMEEWARLRNEQIRARRKGR